MAAKRKKKNTTAKVVQDCTPVDFPVVGIGASAGGLAAFEAFFSGMPPDRDPNMAFVLVQHLAPDHKSILTELIQRYTRMQVFEVADGTQVRRNCAYIIPPNRDMAFLNGALHLLEPAFPRGQRMPIDFFFRSLAQDQRERAICVVLSGTGSDGTMGVRAIKGEGGMAMAQSPGTTEFDGMPRSAIDTGLVDFVLPPAEMAARLIAYTASAFGVPRSHNAPVDVSILNAGSALSKVFVVLRTQTGHDFSLYKRSTIYRRIERRMAVNQIAAMEEYVKYLRQTPAEVELLFRDLLIGVTNFFRDPDAFKALEDKVIPRLFANKPAGAVIRVWSPGCSTGEEAYSIAILMQDRMRAMKQGYDLKIFATDIDGKAIASARTGRYPAGAVADIPPERLARFFSAEPDGSSYSIHKDIRDLIVFSEQDVIKDPPFSKIDLISCRNVLIYMGGELQKKVISLFHYALNPGGFLFLGSSETVGEAGDFFAEMDRKSKLYQRKESLFGGAPTSGRVTPPLTVGQQAVPLPGRKTAFPAKLSLRELTEQALLQQAVPACALVNGQGDMLYVHGRTGAYLEVASGESKSNNILRMAREGLRRDLSMALAKSVATNGTVRSPYLRVRTNGDFTRVNLTVRPVAPRRGLAEGEYPAATAEAPLYLIILEEAAPPPDPGQPRQAAALQAGDAKDGQETSTPLGAGNGADEQIMALSHELHAKEEYLQSANEELKTLNEELESSNEEMQSVNEELQSTNEELETSKEELQSLNEELATVNSELQAKVADLSRANNDMNNLLAGTGIATVFLDTDLHILRFTPTATRIINLIRSDLGRPVAHVVSNLVGYERLTEDAQAVLDTLIPKELDVQTKLGKWYSMQISVYRTTDNVIDGVVITFVDITETKKTREALRENQAILQAAMDISPVGVAIADAPSGILRYVNDAGLLIRGADRQAVVDGVGIDQHADSWRLFDTNGRPLEPDDVPLARAVKFGETCTRELVIRRAEGDDRKILAKAAPVRDDNGKVTAGILVFTEVNDLAERD